jgi:hypothetical protein
MRVGGRLGIRERTTRALTATRASTWALALVLLLLLAGVAEAGVRGRTSQGLPISFELSRGHLTGLKFEIRAVCPSRRVWRVDASGFPPIKVVRSRFSETFGSHKPSARATVKGKVGAKLVTGSLTMKRYIASEGHSCMGSATFTVHR